MKNIFALNKLFISFFLLVTVLINTGILGFVFSSNNTTIKDCAVLERFFSSSDIYLKDISKIFQSNVIVSKTQTTPVNNNLEQNLFIDVIFMEHFNFVNYIGLFYFVLIGISFFLFNCFNLLYFNFDLWRCIVFKLIFKMLFNILPRSISIKTLLNTESLCFVC